MLTKFRHLKDSEIKFIFHLSTIWGYYHHTSNPPISIKLK